MQKEKFDVGELLRKTQEELQGFVLDTAKISPMNDRQYTQFAKTIKNYFRSHIDSVNEVIKAILLEEQIELVVSNRPAYNKENMSVSNEVIINE